ncbi:15251_t:CDS:2 [Funneliformis geosporum]|uniref:15251_t:CDS:1 n=1 Tax=Funneliformis geosporum TaxID=1117311 RepID=A0A9W4SBW0_9GLOM|nr:15251_t:CDS:2 [Funneliformis geosporum]
MVKAQEFINKNYPDKTIKQLNISNKNLEGELGLSEFVNLEELDCSDNQLTNLKFADEKKITKLDIRDNYFTQKDLTFLSTFTNLESLKLGRKRVNPSFVLKTMLSHEDRHFNSFGGSLEPLKDMSKLKELSIINTDISEGLEHLPESLERIKCGTTIGREAAYQCSKICEELKNYALVQKEWEEKGFSYKQSKQWIDLGFTPNEKRLTPQEIQQQGITKSIENYNSISRLKNAGTTPQQYAERGKLIIDDFPNLKRIKSGGMGKQNMINELIISNCPQLEVVDVIYSFAMKELKIINCPNLKKLDCSRSKLTTLDLTNCLNLQAVDCFNNKLKEIKLPLQGGKLEELILNDNKFSAEQDLSFLKDSVNLKTLELGGQGTRGSFCGSLEPLKNMTNLKHLNIKNTNIDSGLEYLPSSLEEIKCYDGLNGKDAKTKKLEEELFFYGNNLKA